jgi:uncharacterized protein YyaL (SSP411 family)
MSLAQPAPAPQAAVTPTPQAHTNRLAKESSPYLRQHAHNPVDWYPWGDEAFAEAKRRQVPIFLSIGYSTCYWCHVMERESFENAEIAKLLNDSFVCIKVDREERPDIDDIYMAAVQAMTGRGGWPMSVWLTPPSAEGVSPESNGLQPFYAGTYFPNQPRQGMASLQQVCANITEAWTHERDKVNAQANHVADAIREQAAWEPPVKIGPVQIGMAVQGLLNIHDPKHGGFGRAPKFPQPVFLDLLMEIEGRIPDPAVAGTVSSALRLTLDKMALGGMYDQLAGGFHRYSTDETWTVPHFEKMLYDNAMLASVYARAHAKGRDPFDAKVVTETIAWALREMRDRETGAFYSAQDAEVDGREGLNYLWTRPQLTEVLGEDDAVFAARLLGFDTGTNFQDPHHPEDQRKNVLLMPQRLEAAAKDSNTDPVAFGERWASVQSRLLESRNRRKQPHLDDKVITSWNGLMIGALADAALSLGQLSYLDEAEKTSKFFLTNMRTKTGGLFRTCRDTKAKTAGFLEDYAYLIQGLLKVHAGSAASGRADTRYIKGAEELTTIALERFSAPPGSAQEASHPGMLFDTREGQPDLIARSATTYDGAMPSAQGVMLHNLIDLYLITRNQDYLDRATSLARALSGEIARSPLATVNSTRAALRLITLKKDAFDGLPEPTAAPTRSTAVDPDTTPVQVHADTDRVTIPKPGEPPATLHLKLTIDEGFHINANTPGIEGMTPLDVRIEGGLGVSASVTYPAPAKYQGHALPEGEGPLMVHSGEVELTVNLSRTDQPWQGRPILVLTYQACDDRACLKPQTISLDVALDPG